MSLRFKVNRSCRVQSDLSFCMLFFVDTILLRSQTHAQPKGLVAYLYCQICPTKRKSPENKAQEYAEESAIRVSHGKSL